MPATNRFRVLSGARAFLGSLQADLQLCRSSLRVQFSTFEGDASGSAFARLLVERAEAGVSVHLSLDQYSDVVLSDTYPTHLHRRRAVRAERAQTRALLDELRRRGVQIRRSAPMGPLWIYALYRDHKKMILLDDHVAYVGGINISDHNFAWHDFMVRIEGPLARDLARDYRSSWEGATVALDTPDPSGDFVLNQCAGRYSIFDEILAMIARAEREVVIESPYLLGDQIEGALFDAAERGVAVRLITPLSNNRWIYRMWSRASRRRLNHPKITYHGYRGANGMTHAKLVLVDRRWASFGSLNLWELEGLTQKELNVFSSDPDLIQQLGALADADLANTVSLPVPRHGFGRFLYDATYWACRLWTQRCLRRPEWRAVYC